MEKLQRKIAYLQGLAEGMDISENQREGRIMLELIDLCKTISMHIEDLEHRIEDQEEYLEAIDDDLFEVEQLLFLEDDDEMNYGRGEDDPLDDAEDGYIEMECPNCQEIVFIDQDIFDDEQVAEVICPECEEVILITDANEKDLQPRVHEAEVEHAQYFSP